MMARYALIRSGTVENVVEAEAGHVASLPGYDHVRDVTDQRVGPGDQYDAASDAFSRPAPPPGPHSIEVTLDAATVPAGTAVTATATVYAAGGSVAPVDGIYYVPILGIDGRQMRLLTVSLTSGEGSATFSLSDAGIYTLRTDLVRPQPTARITEPPELIVTDPEG